MLHPKRARRELEVATSACHDRFVIEQQRAAAEARCLLLGEPMVGVYSSSSARRSSVSRSEKG
jgi:hypothetical protein